MKAHKAKQGEREESDLNNTEIKNGSFRAWLEFWMNDQLNFCLIHQFLQQYFNPG